MRYLIVILMTTLLAACGKPHLYETKDCFYVDETRVTFYKITGIEDEKYLVKLYSTKPLDVPDEYKSLADAFPLPFKMTYEKFEALKLNVDECPREIK